MNIKFVGIAGVIALTVSACGDTEFLGDKPDKTIDRGINSHSLSTLVAGVWVDPNGCDHWIIDDGVEGYLSERLTPDGRPVCSGAGPRNTAVGPYKAGTPIGDPI